jgi:hypothetical protein
MGFDFHNLVNGTSKPRHRTGEPVPASTPSLTPVSAFISPQSFVSFPVASGFVFGVWKASGRLVGGWDTSAWVALIVAGLVGLLIYLISITDKRLGELSRREIAVGLGIGIANSLCLFMAAEGISTGPLKSGA